MYSVVSSCRRYDKASSYIRDNVVMFTDKEVDAANDDDDYDRRLSHQRSLQPSYVTIHFLSFEYS